MEQRRVGHEPLRSSQRRRSFEVFFLAVLLLMLMAFVSGPCGERGAVSSRGPRWWKAGGQARRAGAPCGPVERVWAGGEGADAPTDAGARSAVHTISMGTGAVHGLSTTEHGPRRPAWAHPARMQR